MSEPILPKRQWPAGIQQASVPANDNALRDEAMERPCLGVANDASGSDVNGDLWIVGDTPTGAFATFEENDVALYQFDSWYAWAPTDGLRLIVADAPMIYVGGSTNAWENDTSDGIPDAPSDGATYGRKDGAWVNTTGSGDVVGPASSTANYPALFDGTTGKLLKQGTGALGTAAYTASSAYATAAQGAAADSALQDAPSDGTGYVRKDGAWAAESGGGGGGTPGGSDKQVQYNNSGAFGAEAGFEYDASTNTLTVANITTSGRVLTAASATGGAGLRLPHGAAPTSPTNGDVWTTTAGMYVQVNGATVGPLAIAGGGGGGGLTNWTEAVNTTAPNASIPVVSLTPSNAALNVDAVIQPKGSGAIAARVSDNAGGGNKRGSNAVDLQLEPLASANQVASGVCSGLLAGYRNRASGNSAVVVGGNSSASTGDNAVVVGGASGTSSGNYAAVAGGNACTASGLFSATLGGILCTASGESSVATGNRSDARSIHNSRVHGSYTGRQVLDLPLYIDTTNATPAKVSSNASAAAAGNQWALPSGRAAMLRVSVVARQTAGTGVGDCAGWETTVLVKNIGGTTTIVGTPAVAQAYGDPGAAAWSIALSADDVNDALSITVTGEASKTIRWTAHVVGPEA